MTSNAEQWLLDHTKGLHIRTESGANEVYTSMFARIGGKPYLLTTGHALEEIDTARKQGIKFKEATMFPTNGTEAFPIVDLETAPLYYLHEKDSIDIGLLPLRRWYENQIKQETFIVEQHYSGLPKNTLAASLLAFHRYSNDLNRITSTSIRHTLV